jgi:hypothetical protein
MEPHHLVGAGAVTRCGSGSGSDNGINHGLEFKMTQNVTVYNPFSSYFQQYTVNRTETNEEDSFNMCLNFSSF